MILLCTYIIIECLYETVIGIFVCCNILFCFTAKDKKIKDLFILISVSLLGKIPLLARALGR